MNNDYFEKNIIIFEFKYFQCGFFSGIVKILFKLMPQEINNIRDKYAICMLQKRYNLLMNIKNDEIECEINRNYYF